MKLIGTVSPGSDLREGSTWFRMYEPPLPAGLEGTGINGTGRNGWFGTEVLELGHEDGKDTVVIRDKLRRTIEPYAQVPVALTEDQPIQTKSLEDALADLASGVTAALRAGSAFPHHPALDLVRRVPPRLASGAPLPVPGEGPDRFIDAITAAVEALDHSYVAVQGPPGTGKTHVGSHVIARLVARGWKVGVVGQSHAVVENLLKTAVAKAGVDPARVAKEVKHAEPLPWEQRSAKDVARLLSSPGGALVGGTAWTMTGANVPAGSLDLLVIDEAGQFSLANTLAVAQASSRLLLLGDPQQLPQVSQGAHPEPVDESALGWVSAGHATLPPELGYFLADSWRMTSELCRAVSELSYEGRLRSAPAADLRRLDGVPAGIETVMVEHSGNITSSPEEAAEVVRQVRRHLGLGWHSEQGTRPLGVADILVVAAYNAQVNVIRDALDAAGLARRPGGNRGQVPGPGSRRRHCVHGVLGGGRGAARHGVPALAQPDQRGGLPRPVARRRHPGARADQLPPSAPRGPGAAGRVHRAVPAVRRRLLSGTCPFFAPAPMGHAHSWLPHPRDMLISKPKQWAEWHSVHCSGLPQDMSMLRHRIQGTCSFLALSSGQDGILSTAQGSRGACPAANGATAGHVQR